MLFGIEPFKARRDSEPQSEEVCVGTESCEEEGETTEKKEGSATVHSFLQLLYGFLDSEVRNIINLALFFF